MLHSPRCRELQLSSSSTCAENHFDASVAELFRGTLGVTDCQRQCFWAGSRGAEEAAGGVNASSHTPLESSGQKTTWTLLCPEGRPR